MKIIMFHSHSLYAIAPRGFKRSFANIISHAIPFVKRILHNRVKYEKLYLKYRRNKIFLLYTFHKKYHALLKKFIFLSADSIR